MVDISYEGNDRWNIPDDRQLALRGRLETGWSSYRGNDFSHKRELSLTEEEQQIIFNVLQRTESIQASEEQRIGLLVKNLEYMRKNVLGDGVTTCLICGTKTGLLKESLRYCAKCGQMVCPKCSIERCNIQEVPCKRCYCVLCYEERQLWKRSGAWFYNSIPKYIIPNTDCAEASRKGTLVRHCSGSSIQGSDSIGRGSSMMHLEYSESIDDASDDSDIETASVKAFDIPEDQRSVTWHNQIDVDEESIGSGKNRSASYTSRSGRASNIKGPSFEFSSPDDEDGPSMRKLSNDDRYTSESSLPQDLSPMLTRSGRSVDRNLLHGSSSSLDVKSDKKHKLAIRKPWRKKSRDQSDVMSASLEQSPTLSRKLQQNGVNNNTESVSNNSEEQDIDSMFKSYEEKSNANGEKKEYHGKYGMIEFTLQYDPNTQELLVIIQRCKGLKGEKGKIPSAYVKTYLLPEAAKASKKRTTTIKKTTDPVFDETLVYYGVAETDVQSKGLRLSVMDETKIGGSSIIGETCIPLKNLTTRPVQQFRRILDSRSNDETLFLDSKNTSSNPGRIEIALHYLSKQEKLVVEIIRCAGLKALDQNGYSDPYVKCYLLPDPHKRTKQKTAVKKKTLNPEFNEEFSYKIPHAELAKKTLHVSVWDYDMGRTNDFIGGLTLGIESSGEALRHWFETLKTADRRVIKWHTLSETCPVINE
ncbi:synaptotagmin-17-like [Hydractinia symbiolongicarpus]|uniref:synaptotagmin-17-like n=1 Tax=Hydractinia symbiolongicarpus TaxID=13093 RepID=UPI00254B8162|nr:synaptotagmin-17-like [Hydractinia symbiolongicarpus]XP_057295591.1 synaptotagmin-17-like [Hydractinia symbiolongicarpus]